MPVVLWIRRRKFTALTLSSSPWSITLRTSCGSTSAIVTCNTPGPQPNAIGRYRLAKGTRCPGSATSLSSLRRTSRLASSSMNAKLYNVSDSCGYSWLGVVFCGMNSSSKSCTRLFIMQIVLLIGRSQRLSLIDGLLTLGNCLGKLCGTMLTGTLQNTDISLERYIVRQLEVGSKTTRFNAIDVQQYELFICGRAVLTVHTALLSCTQDAIQDGHAHSFDFALSKTKTIAKAKLRGSCLPLRLAFLGICLDPWDHLAFGGKNLPILHWLTCNGLCYLDGQ